MAPFALRRQALGVIAALATMLGASSVLADVQLTRLGSIGGSHTAVAISGELVFAGEGSNLLTIDVSDPEHPAVLNRFDVGSPVAAIVLRESSALVGVSNRGLVAVDLTDPLNPCVTRKYAGSGTTISDICLDGDNAFVAGGRVGLLAVNLDSGAVSVVTEPDAHAYSVDVTDGFAYVGTSRFHPLGRQAELEIVDVRDPSTPTTHGRLNLGFVPLSPVADYGPFAVAVRDGVAYLESQTRQLGVINVADPDQPLLVRWVANASSRRLAVRGERLIAGLNVLSIADPLNPILLSPVLSQSEPPRDQALEGNLLAVADSVTGVALHDLTNPVLPRALGSLGGPDAAVDIAVLDQTHVALVDQTTGLWTVDIAVPSLPQPIGRLSTLSGTRDLSLCGTTLSAVGPEGLTLIDCADLASPEAVGFVPFWSGRTVASNAVRAYVGAGKHLLVIDITVPQAPRAEGEIHLSSPDESVRALLLAGETLMVGESSYQTGNPSVELLDVGLSASPEAGGAISGLGGINALAASGELLFARGFGLHALGLSGLEDPELLGGLDLPHGVSLAASGDLLFTTTSSTVLAAFDARVPAQLDPICTVATRTYIQSIMTVGDLVLVANGADGLVIYQLQQAPTTFEEVVRALLGFEARHFYHDINGDGAVDAGDLVSLLGAGGP